jgi:hypothetical protein
MLQQDAVKKLKLAPAHCDFWEIRYAIVSPLIYKFVAMGHVNFKMKKLTLLKFRS